MSPPTRATPPSMTSRTTSSTPDSLPTHYRADGADLPWSGHVLTGRHCNRGPSGKRWGASPADYRKVNISTLWAESSRGVRSAGTAAGPTAKAPSRVLLKVTSSYPRRSCSSVWASAINTRTLAEPELERCSSHVAGQYGLEIVVPTPILDTLTLKSHMPTPATPGITDVAQVLARLAAGALAGVLATSLAVEIAQ